MIKEIEKKVEITQEIFHNILKMIKSSNDEDFFIAVESWKNMNPTRRLNMLLYKAALVLERDVNRELGLPPSMTWSEVWDSFNVTSTTDLEKILFTELYNDYVRRVVALSCSANILNINVELKWRT
jgi:hypothetical protein